MKYIPRFYLLLFLLLWPGRLWSQQEPEYSQYTDHILAFNPGYAGSSGMVDVSGAFRQQWAGFEGAPTTMSLLAHTPVNLRVAPGGIGISLQNDEFAFNNNLNVMFTYAYRMRIKQGVLGLGMSVGFNQKSLDANWQFPGSETSSGADPAVPESKASDGAFDASAGLYYETERYFVGISALHLFEPQFQYEFYAESLTRQYYLMGGYKMALRNPSWEFIPSVLLRTDGKMSNFTGNCRFEYNKKFWCGVSYRQQDAIIGLIGIELSTGLRIAYSYDFVVSRLGGMSEGSHEFTIRYLFKVGRDKNIYKYKSIRFL